MPPDGFTGAITAVEGIQDAAVLLNGPTGCKFYHGALSDGRLPRESSMDPLGFSDEFYFGQPRIPATYLDDQDYVFGATEKLQKILPQVAAKGHKLIAVINSPGAALIGDDLERFIQAAGLPVPCIAMESTGFSSGFSQGFQDAVVQCLRRLSPPSRTIQKKRVNLIGLSIFQRCWEGDVLELQRLLALCGIQVHCSLCAGCTVEELLHFRSAELSVVVHPEYADHLGTFLQSAYGCSLLQVTPCAPIGFEETERWLQGVCDALHVDPEPAMRDVRQARQRAYHSLSRYNSLTSLPRGATFSIQADGAMTLALTQWLYHYLGMVPLAVACHEATREQSLLLQRFVQDIDCTASLSPQSVEHRPDLALGSEVFLSGFRAQGLDIAGIDIALPDSGMVEVTPRCLVGNSGTLWLLERILNELLKKT